MEVTTADDVIRVYKEIQARLPMEYHLGRVTYNSPVNFNESLQKPRHRWFPYKEGFSPSFVQSFFSRYAPEKSIRVLDPFAGVGTTVIEAAMTGHVGLGIEINPLAFFIAETKKIYLSSSQLHEFVMTIEQFMQSSFEEIAPAPNNDTVRSYFEAPDFEAPDFEALLRVKAFIYTCQVPGLLGTK